jgi:hypothetical protein
MSFPDLVKLELFLRDSDVENFVDVLSTFAPGSKNISWAKSVLESYLTGILNIADYSTNPDSPVSLQEREIICVENIFFLLENGHKKGGHFFSDRKQLVSPEMHDSFGDFFSPESWGVGMIVNYVLMQLFEPKYKSAAFVTMRDDGLSLIEWVAHYRALGFDHLFIFSNDNVDGSDQLLSALADRKIITYIDNKTSGKISPQRKAFEYSIHLLPELRNYEWVFYLDSDEYLVLSPEYHDNIKCLLNRISERYTQPPQGIVYNWRWFVSGALYSRSKGLLLERFQHSVSHRSFKSLVRLKDVTSMRMLHFPEVRQDGIFLDSNLDQIEDKNLWNFTTPNYLGGRINHYWHKSFEEFALKKRRGDALSSNARNEYSRDFKLYFDWNAEESEENLDVPPPSLLRRIKAEVAYLHSLPGVSEIELAIESKFPSILESFENVGGLRTIFDELSPKADR